MRPKNPLSRRNLSFIRPGRKILSCTTPCLSPDFSASWQTFMASARVVAVGFSQWLGSPAGVVLAGGGRLFEQSRPHLRGCGIEEDLVVLLGQGLVEIGRPALDAMLLRERRRLVRIAADQNRAGHVAGA